MSEDIKERENKIYLNATINEVFATTELVQYYQNPSDKPIEVQIQLPIKEDINLSKFEISMNNKKIISKLLEKEKVKEKYTDAISKGNTAIMSDYSKKFKSYNINIGNLNPKESLCLKTIYNQPISSYDMSYQYIIMKDFPSFVFNNKDNEEDDNEDDEEEEEEDKKHKKNLKEIVINVNINAFSKITRLITNFENKDKNNLTISYNDNYTEAKISNKIMNKKKKSKYAIDLHILFRTIDINKPNLFYQYNPILKKHSYCLNYLYSSDVIEKMINIPEKPDEDDKVSYYTKYQKDLINEEPALFIFLIDQSGSMSGTPIDLVVKSLLIFIQSLPKESYFQLIGFGSSFKKYNESPVIYNTDNINKIKKIIKKLEGNMGGTDIVEPLKDIFNNREMYEKINLSKNILLLTDGEVEDKNECFNLIKDNCKMFRIHSIGIGSDFDKELIKLSGKYGKGSSNFVENLKNINNVVIKILNSCLRPYLYDIDLDFLNMKKEEKETIFVKVDKYIYQDEIINYSFILNEDQKASYIDSQKNICKFNVEFFKNKEKIKKQCEFNKLMNLPEGDNMTKIIIDKYLKNNSNLNEKTEIELAKEYEVLSKNTSLFAEISNEETQKNELINVTILSKNSRSYTCRGIAPRPQFGNKAARCSYGGFIAFRRSSRPKPVISSDSESYSEEDDNALENSYDNQKDEVNELAKSEEDEENECEQDITDLIISQNAIDGFWSKNNETIKVEKLLSEKIRNNVKKICKDIKDKEKTYYTILVIYFISTKYKTKIGEYKLVINKAKNYLKSININYDDNVSKINK